MEATLNFTIPLSVQELATLIKAQLAFDDRRELAQMLIDTEDEYEEPTKEQLIAEMKQAVREVNLMKQGKLKSRSLDELLDEL